MEEAEDEPLFCERAAGIDIGKQSVRQIAQLDQIPGFGVKNAQDLIGEIGTGMSVFPTAGHLCSWARAAPRVNP